MLCILVSQFIYILYIYIYIYIYIYAIILHYIYFLQFLLYAVIFTLLYLPCYTYSDIKIFTVLIKQKTCKPCTYPRLQTGKLVMNLVDPLIIGS